MSFEWGKQVKVVVTLEAQHGIPLILKPNETKISVGDSLYSFYNTASLFYENRENLIDKLALQTSGTPVDIGLYMEDSNLRDPSISNFCEYGTRSARTNYAKGVMDFHLDLVNFFAFQQKSRSKVHQGKISDIVKKIFRDSCKFRNFNPDVHLDIEETEGEGSWYQGNLSDAKFIQDILLPNAYSKTSGGTPFYAWFTTNGVFHFRSLRSLGFAESQKTIKWYFVLGTSTGGAVAQEANEETLKADPTIQPTFLRASSFELLPNDFFSYQSAMTESVYRMQLGGTKTGMDVRTSSLDDIGNYAPMRAQMPTQYLDKDPFGNQFQFAFTGKKQESNFLDARYAHAHRSHAFLEHYLTKVPFSPFLHSGDKIAFNVIDSTSKSKFHILYSDTFIIEQAEHLWDDSYSEQVWTKLVLGRSALPPPDKDWQRVQFFRQKEGTWLKRNTTLRKL